MKLALVIQRCGHNIYAGAETLVLQLGIQLSDVYDVEILTTRAKDGSSWKNEYPEGIEKIGNLKIRRFSVDKERDSSYVQLSQYLEHNNGDIDKGLQFIDANGPVSSSFVKYLNEHKDDYDVFIFFGYIYWLTFNGLPKVREKSILFPQAHDEPWIYFEIYKDVFKFPRGYLFQTNAEKEFVLNKFGNKEKPNTIVGHGIDLNLADRDYQSKKIKLPKEYVLYIGRISGGKGCQTLSDYFNRYTETHDTNLKLVFVGTLEHPIANTKAIIYQNLTDEEKFHVLQNCKIFAMPSAYESLNLACLEAWLFRKPVIVNGKSAVLKEHCHLGQGGLYFENYEEFSECLDTLQNNNELATNLARNGERYVRENYNWNITRQRYDEFLNKIVIEMKR